MVSNLFCVPDPLRWFKLWAFFPGNTLHPEKKFMNLQVFLDGYGRPKSVFIGLKKFLNISLKTFPISVQLWFRKSRMRARILYFFNKQSMLHSLRTKFLRTIPLRIHNLKLRIMSLTMIHLMKKSQEKNIHLG